MSPEKIIRNESRKVLSKGWVHSLISFTMILLLFSLILCLIDIFNEFGIYLSNLLFIDESKYLLKSTIEITFSSLPLLFVLFLSPILIGITRLHFLPSFNNESFDITNIFYYFTKNRYNKTLQLNIMFIFRLILPGLICFLPPLILYCIFNLILYNLIDEYLLYIILIIMIFLSAISLLIYSIRYFIVFKLYIIDDSKNIKYYFEYSKEVMSNNIYKIIKLTLSFIPWFLLCFLVIPMFYVIPYLTESYCISAKYIIELKKETNNYDEGFAMYNSIQ